MVTFIQRRTTRFIRLSDHMGLFIFNIFSNDLLLLLKKKCPVFNYTDDTSILYKHRDYDSAYNDFYQRLAQCYIGAK